MSNTSTNNSSCMPVQEVALSLAINDLSSISILGCNDSVYDTSCLQVSWSYDGVNWSCFVSYDDANKILINSTSDYYVKYRVKGVVNDVKDGDDSVDYTTSIASGLSLPTCDTSNTARYNPYNGLTSALALQQALSDSVSCLVGIPIYYFKLKPNADSRDLTFKEYTLMNVDSVKQIKLIVSDGTMPSSKPEFSDFGLDWQTDWETEISKSMFATAFGTDAYPMEGDLIYIPMMKRMWMVNEAYDEKNGSLMWISTTFKLSLVKYQDKGSVDLGNMSDTIDSLVKTKYDDLFGDEEPLDSSNEAVESPLPIPDNLYPIYMSDATRKYITSEGIDIREFKTWHTNTVITEHAYSFNFSTTNSKYIIYQRKYCGEECTFSFVIGINPNMNWNSTILTIGNILVSLQVTDYYCKVSVLNYPKLTCSSKLSSTTLTDNIYMIYGRWSKNLNVSELHLVKYTYNENIPLYKLQPIHYKFDISNEISVISTYDDEFIVSDKKEVRIDAFTGIISNIKIFDVYINDLGIIMQEYPNHQHLLINDTARPIIDNGIAGEV